MAHASQPVHAEKSTPGMAEGTPEEWPPFRLGRLLYGLDAKIGVFRIIEDWHPKLTLQVCLPSACLKPDPGTLPWAFFKLAHSTSVPYISNLCT